jgi:hypothetical protein
MNKRALSWETEVDWIRNPTPRWAKLITGKAPQTWFLYDTELDQTIIKYQIAHAERVTV